MARMPDVACVTISLVREKFKFDSYYIDKNYIYFCYD